MKRFVSAAYTVGLMMVAGTFALGAESTSPVVAAAAVAAPATASAVASPSTNVSAAPEQKQSATSTSSTTVVLSPTVPAATVLAPSPQADGPWIHSRKSILIEGGATYASASVGSQYYDGNCCRTGFLIGARLEWETSENVSFIPGVRYIQKGGRARANGPDLMIALNYLEIPLHAKYRFLGAHNPVRPYVFGGPNIAFLTSAETNLYNQPISDLRYVTSSTDFSLEVGLGVDIAVDERWSLFFANSYSFGLNDIDNSLDSWRSRTLQLTGGVKIGF